MLFPLPKPQFFMVKGTEEGSGNVREAHEAVP